MSKVHNFVDERVVVSTLVGDLGATVLRQLTSGSGSEVIQVYVRFDDGSAGWYDWDKCMVAEGYEYTYGRD